MLNLDTLKLRSDVFQKLRVFFTEHGYIELDTPALTPILPPDTDTELFQTAYDDPWTGNQKPLYLLPAHDFFLKKAVAGLKVPVFQLSKCYRNGEVADSRTDPEFSLLEAYTPGMTADEAMTLSESVLGSLPSDSPVFQRPPYQRRTFDDVFQQYAGFKLTRFTTAHKLAEKIKELGLPESPDNSFSDWPKEELFELIMTQCVEPALPKDCGLLITDWPSFMGAEWSLYLAGVKTAVGRSEKKDGEFPESSVINLYTDRLVMLLAGENSIENVMPFPFRLKKGYY